MLASTPLLPIKNRLLHPSPSPSTSLSLNIYIYMHVVPCLSQSLVAPIRFCRTCCKSPDDRRSARSWASAMKRDV